MNYVDSHDVKWEIRINTPVIVKACRKLDLTLDKLTNLNLNIADIIEVLPVVLEKQLKEKGISEDDFLEDLEMSDLMGFGKVMFAAFQEAFPQIKVSDNNPLAVKKGRPKKAEAGN